MTKLSVIASRALVGLAFLSIGVNAATIGDKTNFDKNFESVKKMVTIPQKRMQSF